jgi:hypothetical protein
MTGNVARMGEKRNVYRISVGKPEGKRSLGRPRCTWKDDIKGPIHDQSCCAQLFCATQVCPFTIKSISTIHDQSCCTTRNVAQHD